MARREHDAGREYHRQLIREILEGARPEAYEWLRERGIRNYTISKWKLGAVVKPQDGHERFQGRVSIPYFDAQGRERGVRFRRIDGKRPKYDGVRLGSAHLFGVKFTSEDVVYITEGEFDCMVLHQLGFKAVGVPGADAWKDDWRWLFRAVEEIVVVCDGDGEEPREMIRGRPVGATKGVLFRLKVMGSLKPLGGLVRVVRMPDGHDVNSLYLKDRKLLKSLLEGR